MKKHISLAFILFSLSNFIFCMDSNESLRVIQIAITVAHIKHQAETTKKMEAKVALVRQTLKNLKKAGFPIVDLTSDLDESPEHTRYHEQYTEYNIWNDDILKKLDHNK